MRRIHAYTKSYIEKYNLGPTDNGVSTVSYVRDGLTGVETVVLPVNIPTIRGKTAFILKHPGKRVRLEGVDEIWSPRDLLRRISTQQYSRLRRIENGRVVELIEKGVRLARYDRKK